MSKPFELTVADATNNTKFYLPSGGVVRHGVWCPATDADATHPYIQQHIDIGIIGIRDVKVAGELVEIVPVTPEVTPEVVSVPVIETIAEPVVEVAPEPIEEPIKATVKKGPKAVN